MVFNVFQKVIGLYEVMDIVKEALRKTLEEVGYIIPKVMIALLYILIFSIIAIIVTRVVKKVLNLLRLEDYLRPYMKYEVPLTTIIITIINLGIALIALHVIMISVYPGGLKYVVMASEYVGRIVSVAFLVITVFIAINAVMERIRMEKGLRGFMTLLTFLIVTILIVDITSLSKEVKAALTWGLSLGIGLSIGVFTTWYFFNEYLNTCVRRCIKKED